MFCFFGSRSARVSLEAMSGHENDHARKSTV